MTLMARPPGVPTAEDLQEQAATLCRDLCLVLPDQNGDLAIQTLLLKAGLPQVRQPESFIFHHDSDPLVVHSHKSRHWILLSCTLYSIRNATVSHQTMQNQATPESNSVTMPFELSSELHL